MEFLSSSVTMIHSPSYTAASKQEQTWWTLIESWNDEHGMMSEKQEVGKGHIEPAIYITPYSEREEKHTHTSKGATGVTLACV
jgi:hypothetical protein